jgi:hypothetical protein
MQRSRAASGAGRAIQQLPAMMTSTLLLMMVALLLAALGARPASAQGEWRLGRGTFYGNEPFDAWSIHKVRLASGPALARSLPART